MYPTVVMLLLDTRGSMEDVCEISPLNASQLAGPVVSEARSHLQANSPLRCVVRPVHSTMDDKSGFQCLHALQSQGGQEHSLEEIILKVKKSD